MHSLKHRKTPKLNQIRVGVFVINQNHQGSVIAVSSSAGESDKIYTYDSFGVANDGLARFSYTGQISLESLGLYYYKARIYHPKLGRFLQTDPVGYEDQMNLYAYVGNDPVNYNDPTGMTRWKANFGIKATPVVGGAINLGITFDDSTFELSFSAGGSIRYGADVSTELNLTTEPSSYKGNDASAKGTADVSFGMGEETAKIEAEYSTSTGIKVEGKLESALTIDKNGLKLKPNLGVSTGVGAQGEINISIPDTVNAIKSGIQEAIKGTKDAIDRCAANPGVAC